MLDVLSVTTVSSLLSCRGYIVETRSECRRDGARVTPVSPQLATPTLHWAYFPLFTEHHKHDDGCYWLQDAVGGISPCSTMFSAAMMKSDMFHYTRNLHCGRRAVQAYCSCTGPQTQRDRDCSLEVYKYALFQENMHFHSFFNAPICVHEKKL